MRRAYIDIADGQIHARIREGAGKTVLFLHQTASSGAMWEKVIALWQGDERLVAIDTPGFGGSFDPPDGTVMADFVRWSADVVAALGADSVHVVGHHTGAAIGLGLAVSCPDRVRSLAMIGPSALAAGEAEAMTRKLGRPFRPGRSGAYLLQNWEYLRVGGADAEIDLLHREMTDMLRGWRARPMAYQAVWSQNSANLLGQVACPVLMMAAQDDLMFPWLHRAAGLCPQTQVEVLPHGANFEPDLAAEPVALHLCRHVMASDRTGLSRPEA